MVAFFHKRMQLRSWMALAGTWLLLVGTVLHASDRVLPGTAPLTVERPLDEVMVERLTRFAIRELHASPSRRDEQWQRDYSSAEAYLRSVEGHRDRLRTSIGAVDPRATAQSSAHRFELLSALEESSILARTESVTVHAVRWQVLEGITAEGLLLVPQTMRGAVIAIPDADWTPETFCGLEDGLDESVQFVRRLAAGGCLVVIPMLISRSDEFSGHPHVGFTNQPHREFLYRQAFEVGRHIIGYEVQKVLAAVDLIEQMKERQDSASERTSLPIGVAGVGEGGLIALYAAALDTRINATLVSGYFQQREGIWHEPIYRNVWGLLTEFGDAELAALVAPRRLVIEACAAVEVSGPPSVREGRRASAAPGRIADAPLESVRAEWQRAADVYRQLGKQEELALAVSGNQGAGLAGTAAALTAFLTGLGIDGGMPHAPAAWQIENLPSGEFRSALRDPATREKRQFEELQVHVQSLLRRSHQVRDAKWRAGPLSAMEWQRMRGPLRDWVQEELIGRLTVPRLSPNARSRLVLETDQYAGYEVMLDVAEDIVAGGILLLPQEVTPGERRPVVVCQHGLEGTPMDTLARDPQPFAYYKAFSEELARRGFVVYAPQNPYRGGDRFRVLQRMSNPLKRSLFSYIVAQHEQTLDWLATLPQVDPKRIAFYGLSYGGKTALRVPPLVERYALSISSGDFTDWVRTSATNEERFGYIFTSEYEIPEWNMAHVASYAELAMLMAPRPFMVEAGHRDSGQPSEWVAGEFGKVRRFYDQLRFGERAEIEFFDGPHTIHGQGTFQFLERHLKWPAR